MKAVVVKIPINDEYGFLIEYENEEVWIFPDDTDISDLQNNWDRCNPGMRFIDFMYASNGKLLEFEEMIK